MNRIKCNKSSLCRDLKNFGLNPREWTIASVFMDPAEPLLIQNKRAKDFQLLGHYKLRHWGPQLTEVSLLSI